MTEEWRPVKGYEGLYSVSNLGRVRRDVVPKNLLKWQQRTGGVVNWSCGHQRGIELAKKGYRQRVRIHWLVIEAFHNCHMDHNRTRVRFKNGNVDDCSLDNLQVMPRKPPAKVKAQVIKKPQGGSLWQVW